jgi:lipopolysaccharide/colanic/teichoic acid biosynthesis glycosyltransferase
MSLVGPRPQVVSDVERYTPEERHLLDVRPGITDWASIQFPDEGGILVGHPDPGQAYDRLIRPQKIELGLRYVQNASLSTDLRILFETGRSIVRGR